MTPENDDLNELASEIRRLIESNRVFLERVSDEAYEDEEEGEGEGEEAEPAPDDYEEL